MIADTASGRVGAIEALEPQPATALHALSVPPLATSPVRRGFVSTLWTMRVRNALTEMSSILGFFADELGQSAAA